MARWNLFRPILAGATLRSRLLACVGAFAGIAVAGFITAFFAADLPHLLWLVPPMGASAVLAFAVPASPMAQPWPTIGGNVVSALVGITIAHIMPTTAIAAGLAVALAIAAMSLLRCLHPPGGAAALVGLFAVPSSGFLFPLLPVGLNAFVLVGAAIAYHRFSGQSYPHTAPPPKPRIEPPWAFRTSDVAEALEGAGEAFDIAPADLERLLREIERQALARSYRELTCADLMTRPVVSVRETASAAEARAVLVRRDVRRVGVVDAAGALVGAIGLHELVDTEGSVGDLMSPAVTTLPSDPAIGLLGSFAEDRVHAVFVLEASQRPIGVITEADWLNVLTRGLG